MITASSFLFHNDLSVAHADEIQSHEFMSIEFIISTCDKANASFPVTYSSLSKQIYHYGNNKFDLILELSFPSNFPVIPAQEF